MRLLFRLWQGWLGVEEDARVCFCSNRRSLTEQAVKLGRVELYTSPAWQQHEFPHSLCILNRCNKFCLKVKTGCSAEGDRNTGKSAALRGILMIISTLCDLFGFGDLII